MPIAETGESTIEWYAGRFLLLPHRDLTLALVDARGARTSIVELRLACAMGQGTERKGATFAWRVLVVWSDGCEIFLQRGEEAPCPARVGSLHLSGDQCQAFVRLGGLLYAESSVGPGSTARLVTAAHSLTCLVDEAGEAKFVLHTHAVPRAGTPVSSCQVSQSFRAAVEHGRLDLSDCTLQLPVTCQGCRQPVVGEIVLVETLWGKMHPGCTQMRTRSLKGDARVAPASEPDAARVCPLLYQLALPGPEERVSGSERASAEGVSRDFV